jgi:TolA-binding protein
MSRKIKVTQKELKSPDKFREAVSNTILFLSDNYKKILLVIFVVITIAVITFVLINRLEKRDLEANSEFSEASKIYSDGNSQEALSKFLAVREKYPDTRISTIALYYAGSINYELGNYDQSISQLNDFMNSDLDDQTLKDAAYLTLGLSSFNLGKWQEAIDYLSQLNQDGGPYANQARLHIGMSLEKLGRSDEAEEIYKQILNEQTANNPGLRVNQPNQ